MSVLTPSGFKYLTRSDVCFDGNSRVENSTKMTLKELQGLHRSAFQLLYCLYDLAFEKLVLKQIDSSIVVMLPPDTIRTSGL